MAEKRIHELDIYEQLELGDAGYIPATSVWLAVDYTGWAESKKITFDDLLSSIHIEAGRLSSLASRSISVTFGTAFSSTVIDTINVYKESTPISGKTIREEVRYYNLNVTLTGFTLEIDSNEDLTGVIVDYKVMEAL